jgi:uncharacterized protein (DUF1501 family)
MSKAIIAIMMAGGMDGVNAVPYRDPSSVSFISSARQSAPANIRNHTPATSRDNVAVTKGVNTVTVSSTAGITTTNLCYGFGFARARKVTVSSIADNGNGTFTLTLSGPSYKTGNGKLYFATSAQLFDMNENPPFMMGATSVNPALNQNLRWLADAFNTPDTPENTNETKAAIVSLIGPMITKYFKLNSSSGIYNMRTFNTDGVTLRPIVSNEWVKNLTSHNDQQSTWVANAPEGAIEGWGGGIADTFVNTIPSDLMKQLASISLESGNAYAAGSDTAAYSISNRAILLQYPGYATHAYPTGLENATNRDALTNIIKSAAKLDPSGYNNDFHISTSALNVKAEDFQNVLKVVPQITNAPAGTSTTATAFINNIRQILRLMLMNNPNRNFTLTRVANVVTAATAVSTGTATRAAGSTSVTIYAPGHGLFTSNTDTADLTDSVLIDGIDTTSPANGYKITLVPGSEDDYFTVTSTANTALNNAPVTFRLKHNMSVGNRVFLAKESTTLDMDAPINGYLVVSTPNAHTLTFETTNTGELPENTTADVKLIHLDKQVFFTNTPSIGWDTHNSENSPELGFLDEGLAFLDSVGKRMVNADYVGFTMSDFGRTYTTNATGGTDHGWGNYAFVFGKKVKGNRFYGDAIDYNPDGPHIGSNMLIPTTSVYQYGATFAKWMGASDAQVLELFPKLVNWPTNERYLSFL